MITLTETDSEIPVCPHCDKELNNVFASRLDTFLGVRFIYFCGMCRKVLGISHRKGFWMG
jgi:hypothetical protein